MDWNRLRTTLDRDPGWSAYALADLDPRHQDSCVWRTSGTAVVLEYTGLDPSVLFAIGPPEEVRPIFASLNNGRFQFTLLDQHFALIKPRLRVESKTRMWRMVLDLDLFSKRLDPSCRQLNPTDAPAIEALIDGKPDGPDTFHISQLGVPGVFFGCFKNDQLVAMAGTHIVSPALSVAAIGNVYTLAEFRGKGLGTRVTQAVTAHLIGQGIDMIALNVGMENAPAIRCYQKVGFRPHCQYLEGIGRLSSSNRDILGL